MAKSPETSYAEFSARQARIADAISEVGIRKVRGIVVVPTSLGAPVEIPDLRHKTIKSAKRGVPKGALSRRKVALKKPKV